jgi:hypothetical protein
MRWLRLIPAVSWALTAVLVAQPRRGARVTAEELAVLDAPAARRDFGCKLRKQPPELGFDLRYQAGWTAEIKANDLRTFNETFRTAVSVKSADPGREPLLLTDYAGLPALDTLAGQTLVTSGGFALGPGRYRVDWFLRDSRNRVCSDHWTVEVKPSKGLRLAIAAGVAEPLAGGRAFRRVDPDAAAPGVKQYHVKILANFSNTRQGRATLNQRDAAAIAAILRTVAREPRFGRYSLAAFNMDEQRVFYQASGAARIDFPALGEAITGLKLGVIDYQRLNDKNSATKFLTRVLADHLDTANERPDAVLIVGPKFFLDRRVPQEALDAIAGARSPVFYLNYVSRPGMFPWRDALGDAVKAYGGKEFRITVPKDLAEALAEILEMTDTGAGALAVTKTIR